jgi:uncharacterized membrane protein
MRIGGHPVHPMLVHFPVAFWTVAAAAYLAAAAGLDDRGIGIANFANGAGLIMAILAMIAGLSELRRLEARSEAMRVATWHLMVMATAWFCFLLALLLATAAETAIDRWTAQTGAAAGAGIGFILMALGGWLGGRLVYEFGVGAREKPKA